MSGKVFVSHKGEPGGENELPTQQYVDDSVNRLDTRHQALSNNHGTTRAALQQLISDVHGLHTTLADGASTFDLVQSELGRPTSIAATLEHTWKAMSDFVKATDLETATVQTATTLSPGGTINGQPFTGKETVVLDTVSAQDLADTLADYTKTADMPSGSGSGSGGSGSGTEVFVYLPGDHVTPSISVNFGSISSNSNLQADRLGIGSWGIGGVSGGHLNLRVTKIKMWPYSLADQALVGELNR